jgi:hypothetical protein
VLVFFPDRGDVRVAVEADERGLRGKVGFGVRVVVDVVELRGFVEGSMGEGCMTKKKVFLIFLFF